MADQLAFDWPPQISMGQDTYFVSDANRDAHALVTEPNRWPSGKLALIGPRGAGKTHLARLFASAQWAVTYEAPQLQPDTPLPEAGPVVIEQADRLPAGAQEWLFHLHNRLGPEGRLLLTARTSPSRWPLILPDLASRMQATAVARIADPDDRLLAAVLHKHLADRQLRADPRLVPYLLRRIDRSFAAAAAMIDCLDRTALTQGKPVTLRLAAEVLDSDPGEA
jgi:ATPase involved in DNA replication initiation